MLIVNCSQPSTINYQLSTINHQLSTISSLKAINIDLGTERVEKVAEFAKSMMAKVKELSEALSQHGFPSIEEEMQYYAKTIRPLMDEVRKDADALEGEIADDLWPLPTYQEMLFIK